MKFNDGFALILTVLCFGALFAAGYDFIKLSDDIPKTILLILAYHYFRKAKPE